jgi:uncharacterized protein (DUF1697 family)
MPRYVALLRAVNVGGYGKLSMAEFRKVLAGLGFKEVETYIQSGNAVFDAAGSAAQVRAAIAAGLEKLMGARVDVMVRTHEDLSRVIAGNPFTEQAAADGARVHVSFLGGLAGAGAAAAFQGIQEKYPQRQDRFHVAGEHIYFHFPEGRGRRSSREKRWSGRSGCRGRGGTGIRC